MANILNSRIQQKYDTAANWTLKNPVLLVGEVGIESDTNKIKIGDGVKNWKNLPYIDDSKLDKVVIGSNDAPETYHEVYVANKNGTQGTITLVPTDTMAGSVVQRDGSGRVHTANPGSDNHATNKQYVDNGLALKPSLLGDGTAIVSNADLNTVDYYKVGSYQAASNSIATTLTNSPTKYAFLMEVSTIKNTYNNEAQNTSIFRVRKITDYLGNCYIQYVTKTVVDGVYTWRTSAWEQMATRSYIDDIVGDIEALLEAI